MKTAVCVRENGVVLSLPVSYDTEEKISRISIVMDSAPDLLIVLGNRVTRIEAKYFIS